MTHVNKAHIHNYVEFNSVNLECDGKFNNFRNLMFEADISVKSYN